MMSNISNLETTQAEQTYLAEMISHHQAAITMANSLLTFSKNPELIKLSTNIIKAQSEEINWLKSQIK